MTDELERDLTRLFHDRASDGEDPAVPLERLVHDGEAAAAARRRRARLVAAGAVAAAVVLAVAIPLGFRAVDEDSAPMPVGVPEVVNTSTERPDSVGELPTGPPPVVPYATRQRNADTWTLHHRGQELAAPAGATPFSDEGDGLQHAAGTVLFIDTRTTYDFDLNRSFSVSLVQDSGLTPVLVLSASSTPLLSPDGSMLASMSHPGDDSSRVSLHALPSGNEVDHVDGTARWHALLGMDADGRVYLTSSEGAFVWTPGQEPRRVKLPTDSEVMRIGSTEVFARIGDELVHGTVSADGSFTRRGAVDLPEGEGVVYLADGQPLLWQTRWITGPASAGGHDGPGAVTDVLTGRSPDLLVPADVERSMLLAMEGPRTVILLGVRRDGGSILRCSLATGACDRILTDLPDGTVPRFGTDASIGVG